MKNQQKRLVKAFGKNEVGMIDTPKKIGSARYERILSGEDRGCSFCFPHGPETNNAIRFKDLKCWKRYRKQQYRV